MVHLYGLTTAVEWQCAHTVYLDFLQGGEDNAHYDFEGPHGDEINLWAERRGAVVVIGRVGDWE